MGILADALGSLARLRAAALRGQRRELPQTRPEVGPAEDHVQGQSDQDEDDRDVVEMHALGLLRARARAFGFRR